MCHYRLLILFVLTFLIAPFSKAQKNLSYFFRHINQADGLLHNEVHAIAQDGKGFMWIATTTGLQRYDGSRFIYYPEMLSNPAEKATTSVEMYADKKNNLLWINNRTNIEKMELWRNHFTVYNSEKVLKDPSFSFTAYRNPNNDQWLLGRNGLYHYDSIGKNNINYYLNIYPANTYQTSLIAADSISNNTWVTAGPQLFFLDKRNKNIYSDSFNPDHHPLLNSSLFGTGEKSTRLVMTDSRQNVWVSTWGDTFYKYDNATKKVSTWSLSAIKKKEDDNKVLSSSLLINCILEDDHHTIWIGTENAGLLRYDNAKNDFDYCIAQETKSENIRYDYKILSLFQDKEQNIWVGTDKGISIFNPYRQFFNSIRHEESNPLSIAKSEIISCIQISNGDIFIGTWGGGIAVYDSRLNFKRNIFIDGQMDKNRVWSFIQADDKTLWIGCQHGYLLIYNIATGTIKTLHPPEMNNATIRSMEKDDKGNIWMGLHNGQISKWDKKSGKFFASISYQQDSLKNTSPVTTIFIDRAQHCWVSTADGLKEFDLEKRDYTNTWVPDKKNPKAISGKICQGIEEFNDSILLIGTIYGGLNFFNKRTKTFSHLTTDNGLPSNTIYAIKKDMAGYVWFTTDYGLYKFNPAGKKFIHYSTEPGLINSSLHANKFYPLQEGEWLTFTTTEAITFLPQNLEYQNNEPPKTEITGFKVFDKPVFIDSLLYEHKPVRLSYKENFFTVEFAALIFLSLQQTNYYYRLSGIDKEWVNGGSNRFANYTDLKPGEYTFDVKAEIGNSSGEITSFKIYITPPFWKTVWFRSLCFAAIASLIYAFAKWRINTIRNQENRKLLFKNEIAEMEMKALRSQMNPHFIFNCINSIDALIQSNDKYHATVYLNKFAKLLRNILDTSKQNTVLFSKDIETLKLYVELEELRHENKFIPVFKIDRELLNSDYKVPPLIVQPFVENAILHGLRNKEGNEGILTIEIKKLKDKIQYRITDNGIGRESAGKIMQNKESHYGMQMSYDRIKLFNKEETASVEIKDLYTNEKAAGTEVTANLNII